MSAPINTDISAVVNASNDWLCNSALPIWFERGVDWRRGGFFEFLTFDDLACDAEFKRVRVLARQIYVFCAAYELKQSYVRPAISHGLEFLFDKFRISTGGFASRTTVNGKQISGPIDLYDLSFCLFALAHAYKILSDNRLKDEAISLCSFILDQFKHRSGGYVESLPEIYPRRQNPHMHLLEALLEWRSVSKEGIFIEISDEIVSLFFEKFYHSETGVLMEYFDDKLKPATVTHGDITEPGHHFEWVWLLMRYQQISSSIVPQHQKLYDFAHQYGFNGSNGLLWGEVTSFGLPYGSCVRLWPHTEWIKAELTRNDENNLNHRVSLAWNSLRQFLNCPQPGLWYETYDHSARNFLAGPSPASSLYHIVLAIDSLNKFANFWHISP